LWYENIIIDIIPKINPFGYAEHNIDISNAITSSIINKINNLNNFEEFKSKDKRILTKIIESHKKSLFYKYV